MNQSEKSPARSRYLLLAALAMLGAVGGYCYYRFVGCVSGTCAITSNAYISTLYGGVLGFLVGTAIAPGAEESKKQ